jgi:pheromone shutdown protein TraB
LTKDDSQDSFVDASLGSHSGDMREKRSGLEVVADPVYELLTKYQNRILHVQSPICDLHELYLCGTIHIAQKSIDMVQEAMAVLKPHCVMVEMCEERIDGLVESDERQVNISLSHIFTSALQQRSFKSLGIGLLTWLQIKAASFVGSKLGGEIVFAAKAAHESGAWLVLGDRKYSVTIQRVFEHMPMREKIKLGFSLMIEMILLSFTKVKDYLQRTHEDQDFIADELESFSKSLPNFSKVIIHERDEYLAQSILEISRYIQLIDNKKLHLPSRKRILAVVGHGHLPGIQRILTQGGMPLERLHEISSSKHISSTWPGSGRFFMVNTHLLFNKTSDSIAFS